MSNRHGRILEEIGKILLDLSGFSLEDLDISATFLELGFDSLFLIQLSQALKNELKVKISFRQLIENVSTFDELTQFIDQKLPPEALPPTDTAVEAPVEPGPQAVEPPPVVLPQPTQIGLSNPSPQIHAPLPAQTLPPLPDMAQPLPAANPGPVNTSRLEHLITQQLQVMSIQLETLRQGRARSSGSILPSSLQAPAPQTQAQTPPATPPPPTPSSLDAEVAATKSATESAPLGPVSAGKPPPERFGPYKPIRRAEGGGLTEQQQQHLSTLIERFTQRTATSKQLTQQHRPHFADPRGIAGFRSRWKEMVYQISTVRSSGSQLWDVDGNEYIDLAMGFGLNLLGQSPSFVTAAVTRQLQLGVEIGPQSPLAGRVAKLMAELTSHERVTFCNTGSEAVMAALRLARTVSGRDKFVLVSGSYHGNFDQVLVRANKIGGKRRMVPATPGVPQSIADNAIVLDYCEPESLDIIREHAAEIALVFVEPVQASRPNLDPREFLHQLRALTTELDIALVMDEVITGFRVHPGGAQAYFGVKGDMATYGKVVGGGMPIGVLAGRAAYMDSLDSGMWNYGDDSLPEADMTFFAGTFVRHPLALAAAEAVLSHLKEQGTQLQERLNEKTKYLAESLNAYFETIQMPIRIRYFSSLFRFAFPPDLEYAELLYYHLLEKGIYTRGFTENCFLSVQHTDEQIETIIWAVKESVSELQAGGFLPESAAGQVDVAPSPAEKDQVSSTIGDLYDGQRFPLTEAQTEVWLGSQMGAEASAAFNEPFMLTLRGTLKVEFLRLAIQVVVARHEALHLRFSPDGDYQERTAPQALEIPMFDLSDLDESSRETKINELFTQIGSEPFDLTNGPLIRVRMLKLYSDEHLILFSANHIVCDGWSSGVLMDEISLVYSATSQGQSYQLPEATPFSQYALAQIGEQESADMVAAYQYWIDQFADVPAPLDLPTDRPRPPFKSYKGGTVKWGFDPTVYQAIKKVAAEQQSSLFAMMLAAYKLLLARLSGQDDIVVSILTAGQATSGDEALVGHCANLLPLRSKLSPDLPFSDFIVAARTTVLDAYEYQECTFGGILQRLNLARDPSRMPLVEVNFNLDRDSVGQGFYGLEASFAQVPKSAVNFDLFFNINEMESGLFVDCDYNTDLFDESTIQRWIDHYETLLANIAADPHQPIAKLQLLSDADRQEMLVDWNDTTADYPGTATLHELVEQQAARTPEVTAVRFGDKGLTYKNLDHQANQLAHHLQSLGVKPGTLVGIYLERSAEMMVGLLGILKAGGTYIPLDPSFPSQRLAYMIEDSRLSVLITQQTLQAQMSDFQQASEQQAKILYLDSDWDNIAQQAVEKPLLEVSAEQLAYVIYTSGSTGQPKGVQISHRAVVNFLTSMGQQPGLTEQDTLLAVTTLSFDIAVLELFLPLTVGAQLVIASRDVASDGTLLVKAITDSQTSVMQATPATWRMLIDSGWSGDPRLKVLCGGEALPRELANQLLERVGQLWNMYGPTETTIWSTLHQVEHGSGSVPVGRPIANTQIYILDSHMQPVPIGIPGDLYIGGDGLAQGYLNRAELTSEKFVDFNPFKPKEINKNGKLYQTGDLARYLPNGNIEFLGRSDFQVKVRGFRIELGEIETVLDQHPAIRQAVVIVHEDTASDKNLVAYSLIDQVEAPSNSELRRFLSQKLPDYMIPAAYLFLDAFPLTPNGKVNRRELPAPDGARPASADTFVAPRTPIEEKLAAIWSTVLNLEQIGIHDNFFDLGGHSLRATQVIARVRDLLQVDLSLRDIFAGPTIADLTLIITQKLAQQESGNEDDLLQMIEELKDLSEDEIAELLEAG